MLDRGVVDGEERGPVGKGRRFLKLAGMTASVAARYAGSGIKGALKTGEEKLLEKAAAHQLNGERIAKTLGELKGVVMKVGQMASIADDILPAEIAAALRTLQREAPPMSYDVIAGQIRAELGSAPETLFRSFDPKPFAAASIGQVHRAVTDDGREVVVKVQYPGVEESCESDLAHLKLALRAGGIARMHKEAFRSLFEEMKARIYEELDYTCEADHVREFRKFHARHPFIVIPEVVGERSAQRILTLTYEPGDSFTELDAAGYPQEIRNRIGENLFHLIGTELTELGAIHADPNPANFAFRRDGTIVVYDFGCVKRAPPAIVKAYFKTLKAAIEGDWQGVEAGLVELGARNLSGPAIDPVTFYPPWRDALLLPLLSREPYDYAASTQHEKVLKLIPAAIPKLTAFKPPPDVVFIDRAVLGHYGNLRNLRARFAPGELLRPYLQAVLELGATSPRPAAG